MVYTLVVSGALAFVNISTAPRIESNKAAAEQSALGEVLPGMNGLFQIMEGDGGFLWWIGYRDEKKTEISGYIFKTTGAGYSSNIETLVGVDTDGIINGVKILFQQETPGLGDRIEEVSRSDSEPWFTRQFKGKSIHEILKVVKDGGTIDAITGATITSRAVTESINRGITHLQKNAGIHL